MSEARQARELALNARLNHWPPHLGVKSDAEKIEYLATKLDEAATRMFIDEAALEKSEDYGPVIEALEAENAELKEKIVKKQ